MSSVKLAQAERQTALTELLPGAAAAKHPMPRFKSLDSASAKENNNARAQWLRFTVYSKTYPLL